MFKKYSQKINKHNGFTIIETLISVALFIIIVVAGTGALMNVSLIHKKSQDMRSIMDSLNYSLDDMSRNIRTGSNLNCTIVPISVTIISNTTPPFLTNSCPSGGPAVSFISSDGSSRLNYYFSQNPGGNYSLYTASSVAQFPVQLSSNEVNFSSASGFTVIGANPPPTDYQQPLVIIRLVGTITTNGSVTPFSIQTSVSQRAADII